MSRRMEARSGACVERLSSGAPSVERNRCDLGASWTFRLLLAVVAFAPAAHGQIENMIEIQTLSAADAGGCYVGASGSDATMFIRAAPGGTTCDFGDLNPNFCLHRREFPADGADGAAVSFSDMALLRPTLQGDGEVVWFVNNLDLCVMFSNQVQQDACYMLPPTFFVNSVAVQPQGALLGMVPRDLFNINVPANAIQVFGIGSFPSLTLLATLQFTNPLVYPETLDFMTRGSWIVFDASTTPTAGGAWGLYLVNRVTGAFRTLAAPVAGYELRNPVFGQTSDDVIAFDAIDTSTGQATVLTADIVSGAVRKVAELATPMGVPTFNGDDSALVFNREDASVFSTVSLRERPLSADRITPTGSETAHVANGGYATIYRRGAFDDSAVACPEPGMVTGLAISLLWMRLAPRRSGRRGLL